MGEYWFEQLLQEYIVRTAPAPTESHFRAMLASVEVDGADVRPLYVGPVGNSGDYGGRERLRVVVGEGRNREARFVLFLLWKFDSFSNSFCKLFVLSC